MMLSCSYGRRMLTEKTIQATLLGLIVRPATGIQRRPQLIGQSSGQSTLSPHLPVTTVIVIRFVNDVGDCAFHSTCLSHAVLNYVLVRKTVAAEIRAI